MWHTRSSVHLVPIVQMDRCHLKSLGFCTGFSRCSACAELVHTQDPRARLYPNPPPPAAMLSASLLTGSGRHLNPASLRGCKHTSFTPSRWSAARVTPMKNTCNAVLFSVSTSGLHRSIIIMRFGLFCVLVLSSDSVCMFFFFF